MNSSYEEIIYGNFSIYVIRFREMYFLKKMKSCVPVVHLGYQEVRLSCTDFPEISDYVDREKENSSERKRYPPFTLNAQHVFAR